MGCESCGSILNGTPKGCKSNGSCMTGGCNRLNTFDWLSTIPVPVEQRFNIHEVSFKNGSRKEFFRNSNQLDIMTGDLVAVETDSGQDVGRISLSGELVRLQMRKKKVDEKRREIGKIIRKAREMDLDRMMEARAREGATMLRARQIAMDLKLEMKIGEVEFQADKRKATFYYTADDRVDFRELIKNFASEFRIKIEMRQIGARQEAGKIGGIGSCGRELCCSTWLSDFKSVSTAAARYQNLAINQSKLSGQCGRLKCCLNYELDTYMEANRDFPKKADVLQTEDGEALLIKTDIFKRIMYYSYRESSRNYGLPLEEVNKILALNREGKKSESLSGFDVLPEVPEEVVFVEDAKVSLSSLERTTRRQNKKKSQGARGGQRKGGRPSNRRKNKDAGVEQKGGPHKDREKKTEQDGKGGNRYNKGSKTSGRSGAGKANKPRGKFNKDRKNSNEKNSNPEGRSSSSENKSGGKKRPYKSNKSGKPKTGDNKSRRGGQSDKGKSGGSPEKFL